MGCARLAPLKLEHAIVPRWCWYNIIGVRPSATVSFNPYYAIHQWDNGRHKCRLPLIGPWEMWLRSSLAHLVELLWGKWLLVMVMAWQQAVIWTIVTPDLYHRMVSLGRSELYRLSMVYHSVLPAQYVCGSRVPKSWYGVEYPGGMIRGRILGQMT